MPLPIAVHSAHPVLHAGLQSAINRFSLGELELLELGDIRDHQSWLSELQRSQPRVLLIDVQSFVPYGLLTDLQAVLPDLRIVLWVTRIHMQTARHAIDMGVRGVLTKESDLSLLVRCLERVAAGEMWLERKLTDQLLGAVSIRLSNREMQLLALVTQGLSNKEIAHALELTEGTVKQYFTRLFRKCGVNDRLELVFYGMRNLFGDSLGGNWANLGWTGPQLPSTFIVDRSEARLRIG